MNEETLLVAQIILLLCVGRGLGEVMQRIGQPAVLGQLLAGLILGPSLFGRLAPATQAAIFPRDPAQANLLAGISDIGILLLLLLTGMETDLPLARRVGRPIFAIVALGIAVPFAAGVMLGQALPANLLGGPEQRIVASLFIGTALSISSIKIVAVVIREMDFTRRDLGQIIVAAAILEDSCCWVIIALILSISGSQGGDWRAVAGTAIGTMLFLAASATIGRRFVFWLIRFVNDRFVSEYAVLTAILIVMGAMALVTARIGAGAVLGAFAAGVLVRESPVRLRHIEDQLRGFVTAFIMPVFFGLAGLRADLTVLGQGSIALSTLLLLLAASLGKFSGAFGGGLLGGLRPNQCLALGCAMNARGSTEIIVARIGLSIGVLSAALYSMIVTMAVLTTLAMPPMLRWALRRLPPGGGERKRLEREAIDAQGFLGRIERMLAATDSSQNGGLAARIAGIVAGLREVPLTLVHFSRRPEEKRRDRPEQMIQDAIGKGYDILFVGLRQMAEADGTLAPRLGFLMAEFTGPVALVFAGEGGLDRLGGEALRILVPITGAQAARRGAELAAALFPSDECALTALLVAESGQTTARLSRRRREAEDALFEDMRALAGRYGHDRVEFARRQNQVPHAAILDEARRQDAVLIAMGLERRTESALLGETADALLRDWPGALVLLYS